MHAVSELVPLRVSCFPFSFLARGLLLWGCRFAALAVRRSALPGLIPGPPPHDAWTNPPPGGCSSTGADLHPVRRTAAHDTPGICSGFARPRQDVRHPPPHGNVRAFICRCSSKQSAAHLRRVNIDDTSTLQVSVINHRRGLAWFGAGSNPANGSICVPCEGAAQHAGHLTA